MAKTVEIRVNEDTLLRTVICKVNCFDVLRALSARMTTFAQVTYEDDPKYPVVYVARELERVIAHVDQMLNGK